MRKELLLTTIIGGLVALEASRWAFTRKQREFIRQRDGQKCNFPEHLNGHKHECGGRLEVHHLLPQGYCQKLHIDPDFVTNGITICRNAHHTVHPDMKIADAELAQGDQDAYQKAHQKHNELMAHGEIYWDPSWDRSMLATAVRNTQKVEAKGLIFPNKYKK